MDGKLGGMESRGHRFEFGLLVLLACAIIAWRGEDHTPQREVVELVSVVYKPARSVPVEPADTQVLAGGDEDNAVAEAPARMMMAANLAAPEQPLQARAPLVAQRVKSASRQGPAAVRSPRASVASAGAVKVACRPPACPARARATNTVTKQFGNRQVQSYEPALPAVFVPIRKLGLRLQARLDARHGNPARPRERAR